MKNAERQPASADDITDLLHTLMDRVSLHTMEIRKHFVKTTGLSMPQVTLLMLLFHRGHKGLHEIAEKMDFTGPAASQLVDKLVQAGLVERKESTEDRRAREVALSEKGLELLSRLGDAHSHFLKNLVGVMTPQERALVHDAIPILIDAEKRLTESMHASRESAQCFSPKND